jgi:hypothetical protein
MWPTAEAATVWPTEQVAWTIGDLHNVPLSNWQLVY